MLFTMNRPTRRYSAAIRDRARTLRQQGLTYTEIIAELGGGISKNTLSGWVGDIELTEPQRARIRQIEIEARAVGRPLAAVWHREGKRRRLEAAQEWADATVQEIMQNPPALFAFMSALWLGEGTKKDHVLEFTNSDPALIRGWLVLLRTLFEIDESRLRAQILINQRMDENRCLGFWSEATKIPLAHFNKSQIDARTGKKEKAGYQGVLRVTYNSAELRRKIGALGYALLREVDRRV
jgi:hypothetical protein